MKKFTPRLFVLIISMLAFSFRGKSEDWPKLIQTDNGTQIKVYQPEPESFKGNVLMFRSAISIVENGSTEPVFGAFWATAKVETDRDNRVLVINSLDVTSIRIPAITDQDKIDFIDDALETQFPKVAGPISLDEIVATLNQNHEETKLSNQFSNTPPKVMFVTRPSMLVLIDGTPKLQHNADLNVDMVANSPFTIVKNNDGQFYLYGAKHWYISSAATGPYSYTNGMVPDKIQQIEQQILAKAQNNNSDNNNANPTNSAAESKTSAIPQIIVSTVPAELIQSDGEPNFTPVNGTALLYVSNSDNDIFMDDNSQQYFVLISGRWYQTNNLNSDNWKYTPADHLPADFANIPAGSPKDNVLSSVAGTDAAKDAVMDAEIPQTAKVDRHNATTEVNYDGRPKFTDIEGTNLQYAVNTSSTVLRNGGDGKFYVVDNGVWFVSQNASGPFVVSTVRPADVDLIPPNYPVYNAKYVNIYDVNDDYAYMGYTPGYLNSYVYGPTVVYGTGYYYQPWYGAYYYPRPWSWGFNYCYTPYYGWGFGWGYGASWFSVGFGWGYGYGYGYGYGHYGCGWWGPSFYHPACWGGWHGGPHPYGFYGNSFYANNNVHVNYSNNVYRYRGGVTTQNYTRSASSYNGSRPGNSRPNSVNNPGGNNNSRPNSSGSRPGNGTYNPSTGGNGSNRPATAANPNNGSSRPSVYSDRQGNVYQGQQSNWQQRSNRQWSPVNNSRPEVQNLNRQQVDRSRGEMRSQNFQRMSAPSSGGGGRPSGGGGGGSHPSSGGGGGGGGGRHGR